MNEPQLDANKVIESLLRQVSEYAQKVAMLEAYIASAAQESQEKDQ
jgi:hypothetical protein